MIGSCRRRGSSVLFVSMYICDPIVNGLSIHMIDYATALHDIIAPQHRSYPFILHLISQYTTDHVFHPAMRSQRTRSTQRQTCMIPNRLHPTTSHYNPLQPTPLRLLPLPLPHLRRITRLDSRHRPTRLAGIAAYEI